MNVQLIYRFGMNEYDEKKEMDQSDGTHDSNVARRIERDAADDGVKSMSQSVGTRMDVNKRMDQCRTGLEHDRFL